MLPHQLPHHTALPHVKGRGSGLNLQGRFEAEQRLGFDDGWFPQEAKAPRKTVIPLINPPILALIARSIPIGGASMAVFIATRARIIATLVCPLALISKPKFLPSKMLLPISKKSWRGQGTSAQPSILALLLMPINRPNES
jgi:hypothetical protein